MISTEIRNSCGLSTPFNMCNDSIFAKFWPLFSSAWTEGKKKRTGKNDLKFGVVNIRNQCWRVEVFGFSAYSWICLRCLITLYHGKSPLNHNLVNILYFFPTTLKANRSIGGWVFISFFFWVCYDINKAKCIQGVLWCFFFCVRFFPWHFFEAHDSSMEALVEWFPQCFPGGSRRSSAAHKSRQFIATFPAGWSPWMVVKSRESYPKWPKHSV